MTDHLLPDDTEAVQRNEIARLFAQLEAAGEDPLAIFAFQADLAKAISAIEPRAFSDKDSPHRDHLRRLRSLGDVVAWRLLHPYAIRQLAKNQAGGQAISNQSGFAATMRLAKEHADLGLPVVVCDLTNCLRIGDVVTCADPERPVILESGGRPEFRHLGRKARQAKRAQAVSELLTEGAAQLYGSDIPTLTLELGHAPNHSWDTLEQVILSAMSCGEAWALHAPGDAIYATATEDEFPELPSGLLACLDEFSQVMVGTVLIVSARPGDLVPPPGAWPIAPEPRLAVLRSDVIAVHFVDLNAFAGPAPGGELITVESHAQTVSGFRVQTSGVTTHLSGRLLDEVVSGFQTIESARTETVAVARTLAPLTSAEDGPVASVETVQEARDLLAEQERLRDLNYVSMPMSLLSELQALIARR